MAVTAFARRESRPLKELAKTANAFGHGNLEARVRVEDSYSEETRDLAIAFNNMASSLQKSEYQRQEFVANVSHELRTPLTNVRSYAETIRDAGDDIPRDMENNFLDIIITETDRMTHIVQDLLTLSRLDSGRSEMNMARFPFSAAIDAVLRSTELEARRHKHALTHDYSETLPLIMGDRGRIEQVMLNVLGNAVKYTPPGSTVQVSLFREGDQVVLTVEDNGIITVVDRITGLIYQYDQEGNLLCTFGGIGTVGGLFQIPVSIDHDSEGFLYVLDYNTGSITVFKPTHFIKLIHQAVTLHGEGRYAEALDYWQQALKIDSNYALAHQGVAKVMGKQENWEDALASYYLADDKVGYSEAFAEYRHETFRQHFVPIVLGIAVGALLLVKLLGFLKKKADQWADDVQMGRGL